MPRSENLSQPARRVPEMGYKAVEHLLRLSEDGKLPFAVTPSDMSILLVLAFKLFDQNGVSSWGGKITYDELAKSCGYSSGFSVNRRIRQLVKAKVLEWNETKDHRDGGLCYIYRLTLADAVEAAVSRRSRPEPEAAEEVGTALPREEERPAEPAARKARGALTGLDRLQRGLLRYLARRLLAHWGASRDGEPKPAEVELIAGELAKKGMAGNGNGLNAAGVIQACAEALEERVGRVENPVALVRSKVREFEMKPLGVEGMRLVSEIKSEHESGGTVK